MECVAVLAARKCCADVEVTDRDRRLFELQPAVAANRRRAARPGTTLWLRLSSNDDEQENSYGYSYDTIHNANHFLLVLYCTRSVLVLGPRPPFAPVSPDLSSGRCFPEGILSHHQGRGVDPWSTPLIRGERIVWALSYSTRTVSGYQGE